MRSVAGARERKGDRVVYLLLVPFEVFGKFIWWVMHKICQLPRYILDGLSVLGETIEEDEEWKVENNINDQ